MEDRKQQALFLHAANVLSAVCLSNLSPSLPADIWQIRYMRNETHEDFASGYISSPHRHDFYELHLMKHGEQNYRMDGIDYPVADGGLLLIPRNHLHVIPSRSGYLSKYCMCFSEPAQIPNNMQAFWDTIANSKPLFLPDAYEFISLFEMVLEEAGKQQYGWIDNVRNLLSVFLTKLIRLYEPELPQQQVSDHIFQHESDQRVMFIERFVRDNLEQPISCEMLANYLHVSVRQLNRNVQKERNMPLRTFIDEIKYQAACRMLSSPRCSVSSLYIRLGFSDESSFHRFFKRHSGMSPSAWRKSYRQKDAGIT